MLPADSDIEKACGLEVDRSSCGITPEMIAGNPTLLDSNGQVAEAGTRP
jgi:hypothetical protein